jgi:hypothetical protein
MDSNGLLAFARANPASAKYSGPGRGVRTRDQGSGLPLLFRNGFLECRRTIIIAHLPGDSLTLAAGIVPGS